MTLRALRLLSLAAGLAALLHAHGACPCGHVRVALSAPPEASHCGGTGSAGDAPLSPPAHRSECPHCAGQALLPDAGLAAACVPAAPAGLDLAPSALAHGMAFQSAPAALLRCGAGAHAPPLCERLSLVLRI